MQLLLIAALFGGLVIDQRLPDVNYQRADPNPANDPPAVTKNCRADCKCPKADCQCGANELAAACADLIARGTLDEAKLKEVAAVKVPTLIGFAPKWCRACKQYKDRLGDGDEFTRIEWQEAEAHFTPEAYPCLYDPKQLKQLCGGNIPRTMDEVRQRFGIAKMQVVGITVGTLPREYVELLREALGESGRRYQSVKELTRDVPGLPFSAKITVPAESLAEWSTKDGVLIANFTKRPRVVIGGVVNQDLARVVITETTVTLELPWAPDAVFNIE